MPVISAAILAIISFSLSSPEALAQTPPAWLQSSNAGLPCETNRNCGEGAICLAGICTCLPTHVFSSGGQCLPKLGPGESPCISDEQCIAAWPETRCENTICQCTKGRPIKTRDGIICVDYGSCPFGGSSMVLRDDAGLPVSCTRSPEGFTAGCLDQLDMYDCIQDRSRGRAICCPNQANACSQPLDPGNYGPSSSQRWFHNLATGACQMFTYLGSDGNSNNFYSKDQCESYCGTKCPRGNPLFTMGLNGIFSQFAQLERSCDPTQEGTCPDFRHTCTYLQQGKALCCPSKMYICGTSGGTSKNTATGFDPGVPCGPSWPLITRFYYNSRIHQCQPFQYRGCGGNFNNFATMEECLQICANEDMAIFDPNPVPRIDPPTQPYLELSPKLSQFENIILRDRNSLNLIDRVAGTLPWMNRPPHIYPESIRPPPNQLPMVFQGMVPNYHEPELINYPEPEPGNYQDPEPIWDREPTNHFDRLPNWELPALPRYPGSASTETWPSPPQSSQPGWSEDSFGGRDPSLDTFSGLQLNIVDTDPFFELINQPNHNSRKPWYVAQYRRKPVAVPPS